MASFLAYHICNTCFLTLSRLALTDLNQTLQVKSCSKTFLSRSLHLGPESRNILEGKQRTLKVLEVLLINSSWTDTQKIYNVAKNNLACASLNCALGVRPYVYSHSHYIMLNYRSTLFNQIRKPSRRVRFKADQLVLLHVQRQSNTVVPAQ